MAKLVPIDSVKQSEYNPRKNDEKRLALTEMSLRKLGFLMPIYADTSGEILSGHQRQTVAKRMGFTMIPVEFVEESDLYERKVINLLFNRATNDLEKQDSCDIVKRRLYNMDIDGMCNNIPDIKPDSEASFPCIYSVKRMDATQLAMKNHKKFDPHIKVLSRGLEQKLGKPMLIVTGPDGDVINGIGRLQYAVETKRKIVKVVEVTEAQKEFAKAMLNLLTMDFSVEDTYADILRYNSFMREWNTRETDEEGNCALGDGFYKGVFPKNIGRDFFRLEGDALKVWVAKYGDKIVDFGAGKLANTRTLRNAGLFVSAMEPYFVTNGNIIHKPTSIEINEKFLDEVESGVEYTSVFISSVFNSVPFMADRKKMAVIAAALCYPHGQVVCWCQSNECGQFTQTKKKQISDETKQMFAIDYEPNTIMGNVIHIPKVQKGHMKSEMEEIFSPCFGNIKRLDMITKFWYLEADHPTVDPKMLAEALDFEFELPYPDGTTMGLSKRAREAFEKRLGIKLPEKGGTEDAENGE